MSVDFTLLDRIPLGAFAISRDYSVLFWNLCMELWTDIPSAEAIGRDLRELFPGFRAPGVESRLETAFDGGPPVVLSYQLHGDLIQRRTPTMVPRVRQCTASALPSAAGLLFAVEDRTDIAAKSREARAELARREAVEAELRKAVAEKEMLMRELKHRVKNNLNMVRSLISLERDSTLEGPARERLSDLESRVNSISALHDSLHDFKVGSDMEAAAYLASIAEHIFSAFAGRPGSPALALELERTTVHSEQILYLGLAVNELLTNAVKYGGKRVSLGLRRLPGGFVEATVADDGPGFSAPIPMRPGGLGLRLAGMLVEQMGGTLTADGSAGGLFRIRIPC